jgi:Xaa-Pro aminopeptidase
MTEIRNRDGRDYLDVDRASAMIGGSGFLGVLAASPENVTYLSGFFHPDLRSLPERMHLVLWPAEGEPVFIVPSMRALHWLGRGDQSFIGPEDTRPLIADVRPYDGEDLEMVRVLAEVLQEKGLTRGVLGVEMRNLPLKVAVELTRLVPGVHYEDAWPLFDAMRAVKSTAELAMMTRVNRVTAECLDTVLATARPGETEFELAGRVSQALWEHGAQMFCHTTLATGPRSTGWHATPSNSILEEGMLIRTDWGIRMDGYGSDIARNAVVGRASAAQRDRWARVSEVHDVIVDAVRPGVIASDLSALARREYARLGLDYHWGIVGHSIGLMGHEAPQLLPDVHQPVLAGMVLEIELGYFGDNEVYHIEDLIHVTDDGPINLTQQAGGRTLIESGAG